MFSLATEKLWIGGINIPLVRSLQLLIKHRAISKDSPTPHGVFFEAGWTVEANAPPWSSEGLVVYGQLKYSINISWFVCMC